MILFFVRRYNDVDHITPVVYRLAKDGYKDVVVLSSDPRYDIKNDFRLNFLKDQYAVEVDYVYRYFMPTTLHKVLSWIICRPQKVRDSGRAHFSNRIKLQRSNMTLGWRFINKICKFIYILCTGEIFLIISNRCVSKLGAAGRTRKGLINKTIYERVFGFKWSLEMLRTKDVSLLVFEWSKPGRWNTSSLVKAGKRLDIPVIAIPHGMNLVESKVYSSKLFEKGIEVHDFGSRWNEYDAVVVQHLKHKKRAVDGGVILEKLYVLGSARFCSEWENVYYNIIPKSGCYEKRNTHGKLRIVFMDHGSGYRVNVNDILDTIEKISRIDFVDLVVKPSTGTIKGEMSTKRLCNIAKVDNETSSAELILWADVLIGTISSIALDALIMNKVFIYPKYFHNVKMMWETMEACWVVNNYTELEKALHKIKRTPGYKQYKEENVNKLITDTVYGGIKGRDVLGDYEKFILSLSRKNAYASTCLRPTQMLKA